METVANPGRAPWSLEAKEELANALTHGFGTALAIAGLVLMVVFASLRGSARHIVGASIFGASMVLLYLMSTLYHSFRGAKVKKVFRILDHASIYVLIAGTYTPLCLGTLRGAWGWSMFGTIWGLAVLGITFKAIFIHKWEWLSLAVYLLMGWLVVIAILPLSRAMPAGGLLWLFGGGLFYSLGAGLYAWRKLPYHHALWHLCVVGGTACHFACVLGFVIPGRA